MKLSSYSPPSARLHNCLHNFSATLAQLFHHPCTTFPSPLHNFPIRKKRCVFVTLALARLFNHPCATLPPPLHNFYHHPCTAFITHHPCTTCLNRSLPYWAKQFSETPHLGAPPLAHSRRGRAWPLALALILDAIAVDLGKQWRCPAGMFSFTANYEQISYKSECWHSASQI